MSEAVSKLLREKYRPLVPKLVELTEDVVMGDIWERPGLSKRDRSLITIATLIATNRLEQLGRHLDRAVMNGVTREEVGELITHLAIYAGWPAAMSATRIAVEYFEDAAYSREPGFRRQTG
jgi:4-carboxymuconolactone decarboxylase